MKSSSGSKKTNPNKANFKRNLAKVGHHEGLPLTEGLIGAIINNNGFLCQAADKKPAFGESDNSSPLIGFQKG